jgi:hypothetical protein
MKGLRVMLDSDLAEQPSSLPKSYSISREFYVSSYSGVLEEHESLRCQNGTPKEGLGGRKYLPLVFTKGGMAMLSSVLT